MKFNTSEEIGELDFGNMWISLDGRPCISWYRTYKEAKEQYLHLKGFCNRDPSFIIRIQEKDLK